MRTRMGYLLRVCFIVILVSITSSGQSDYLYSFGTKVQSSDSDVGLVLSPFYSNPKFSFVDANTKYVLDPDDPIYLIMDPNGINVSQNDIRLTLTGSHLPGTQVKINDADFGYHLTDFGSLGIPFAEVRYFDTNGDKCYSLEDPVYLDVSPGTVSINDLRLTGYLSYSAGTRVANTNTDRGASTSTLPGMICFLNIDGNIDEHGHAAYDKGDPIYIDTQYPFYQVTPNDIRLFNTY